MNRLKVIQSLSFLSLLLLAVIMIPQWVYCMGSRYEDCSPNDPVAMNRLASQSLQLTKNIKYEAQKYPRRLNQTVAVMNGIEANLIRAKNLTTPGKTYSNLMVKNEVNAFAVNMTNLSHQYGNVMEALFTVFRESIQQTNADKRYFLNKLKEYNDMAVALGDYYNS